QLRICTGIGGILGAIGERVNGLVAALEQRRRETADVDLLADLLVALHTGRRLDVVALTGLAETLLDGARPAVPLRVQHARTDRPAHFIAAHSLTVAQVAGRLLRHDPDLRHQSLDTVLAALLHDAGMLGVSAEILSHVGPLEDAQRRLIEGHTADGAERIRHALSGRMDLAEAAAGHHERLDGTGYPAGLRDVQIPPLCRLLAVCDTYAARCTPRPHRP